MKVLKREARKKLLGGRGIHCGCYAHKPRDMPDYRLRRPETSKQRIERRIVVTLRETPVALGDEKRDMAVGRMRQTEQILKVNLLRR